MSNELETQQDVEGNVYVLDDGNNKHIAMTKEETEAKIAEALTTGTITDDFNAFIQMIKEQNKGAGLKFWLGTKSEYLALENTDANTIYFLTDNTNLKDLDDALATLVKELQDGSFAVAKATNALKVNNVDIQKDDKSVLRFNITSGKSGGYVIPYKIRLWGGEHKLDSINNAINEEEFNWDVDLGDKLEVVFGYGSAGNKMSGTVILNEGYGFSASEVHQYVSIGNSTYVSKEELRVRYDTESNTVCFKIFKSSTGGSSPEDHQMQDYYLLEAYKVIDYIIFD